LILILVLLTVAGLTIAFVAHECRYRIAGISAASGAVSLASGLATSLALTAHLVTVMLRGMAGPTPIADNAQHFGSLALGIAILIPGLLCLTQAGALVRGELHAQKRTLAASVVIAGFTFPTSGVQPLAAVIAALAIVNICVLLASRTNQELSAPAASLHY
jgi:hypothetical protein